MSWDKQGDQWPGPKWVIAGCQGNAAHKYLKLTQLSSSTHSWYLFHSQHKTFINLSGPKECTGATFHHIKVQSWKTDTYTKGKDTSYYS